MDPPTVFQAAPRLRLPGLALAASFALGSELARWALGISSRPVVAATCAVALLLVLASRPAGRRRRLTWLAATLIAGALRLSVPGPPELGAAAGPEASGPLRLEGVVVTVPVVLRVEGRGQELARATFTVRPEPPLPGGRDVRAHVLGPPRALESLAKSVRVGRPIELHGRLLPERRATNPGERPFRGKPSFLAPGPAAVALRDGGRGGAGALAGLRAEIHRIIEGLYDGEPRGLMLSLLLGDRRLLSERARRALVETGTFHFLAISGLHVGIVLVALLRLPFPRGARTAGTVTTLALFAVLTGGAPPVLRASLMASIHLVTRRLGRSPRAEDTLGWTALLLLALEPSNLRDPAFQLSFVAVHGILVWGRRLASPDPLAETLARRLDPDADRPAARLARGLRQSAAISVATSIATAPLVLQYFGRVHPLGPLWTLCVYPLAAMALVGGLASVALGALFPAWGAAPALLATWALEAMVVLLDGAASAPGSCVYLPAPAPWQVVACYAILFVLPEIHLPRRLLLAADAIAFALVLLSLLAAALPRAPRCVHLDVSGASAALLQVPGRGSFLIDAGGRGRRAGERLLRACLASGTRRLAGIFLSHPHDDHVRALPALLRALPVDAVYVSELFETFPPGRDIIRDVEDAGVRVVRLSRGDLLRFGGEPPLEVLVLYPAAAEDLPLARSANETSLALMVSLGASRILWLGDLEEQGIARLLGGRDDLRADVLDLPHHGHHNRRFPDLLRAVRPRAVVVSGSGRLGGAETVRRLEARGYEVHATWRDGALETTWKDGRWTTRPRKPRWSEGAFAKPPRRRGEATAASPR